MVRRADEDDVATSPTPDADRLARLEHRVARLEARHGATDGGPPRGEVAATADEAAAGDDRFWALAALRARTGPDGGVVFAGEVDLPGGEHVEWQWGRPTTPLLDDDWPGGAEALSALGHPVRLLLLREVLRGTRSAADLAAHEDLGTSGQVYHHLRQLVAAGWLRQRARGEYVVPAERVVPLLVVVSAVIS